MTTLITGIGGGLAQRGATMLLEQGEDVAGVDYRAVTGVGDAYPVFRASYNKTAIEDVFRKVAPKRVLHLGRIGNLSEPIEKRFELNVIGSQKLMNLCVQHDVQALVVLSTFHIYGAHPRNHVPLPEDDPLRAGTDFPEIADAIQLDNMASTWIYKHPSVRTVVLRPTNVVGPNIDNTMCRVLRRRRIPALAGYNPMTQFVHEDDLARAVIAAAKGKEPSASSPRGVYNIAGPAVVPWRTAMKLRDTRATPTPSTPIQRYVKSFSKFPAYLIRFFKYPCVITDASFRRDFGWEAQVDITETLRSSVASARHLGPG